MLLQSLIRVDIKLVRPDIITLEDLPTYGTYGSAGVDLRAAITEPAWIAPGESVKIPLGIAIHINDPNYAAMILPRSGLGSKGLVLGNLVGLIDSDYQGELSAAMWNRTTNEPFTINPLDRIAQLIFVPVVHAKFNIVDEFPTETERGRGGYGSTGVK